MKTNHAFLISIRPRFAEMIFAGSKTFELRRVCPKVSVGDLALVYVSSPAMELRGSFEVGKILTASPSALWKKIGESSGVTRAEFFTYFKWEQFTDEEFHLCPPVVAMSATITNILPNRTNTGAT